MKRLLSLDFMRRHLRQFLHGALVARCPMAFLLLGFFVDRGKHRDVIRGLAISEPARRVASGASGKDEFLVAAGHLQLFDRGARVPNIGR